MNVDSGVGEADDGPMVAPDPTQPASTIARDATSPTNRGPWLERNLLFAIACLTCPTCALAVSIFSKTTPVEVAL